MLVKHVSALDLSNAGRWHVELFTHDDVETDGGRWGHISIGEIVDESTLAMDPTEYGAEKFYYIGLENVESVTGDPIDLRKRTVKEVRSRSKIFRQGYVLYGRLRPYLRKVFVATEEYAEGLCSTEFIVLQPHTDKILPVVLRALLASEGISRRLGRLQAGAALPRVPSRDFFRVSIPLPPMEVQEEMAHRVNLLCDERLKLKGRLENMSSEVEQIVREFAID